MDIGERLRLARMEARLTLRQAEAQSGVNKDTISRSERGLHKPHPLTIARLAEAYGHPADEFLEVPPETTSPKVEAPPLNELLEAAGCETRWLALPDEEWHEAYSAPTPEEGRQKALQIGREVQDEYLAVRPDLVEGMQAERLLYPDTPWWECPFGSVWVQTGRRYREAYSAARKALEDTDDPTDGGRFPPPLTPGVPEPVPGHETRYIIWEEVEPPELIASAPIP